MEPGEVYLGATGAPSSAWTSASMGDGSTPAKVSRSNFSAIKAMEENHQKASAVRQEHYLRQEQLREQRERFKQRGQMLRAQRTQSQEQIKQTIDGCHARAQSLGDRSRAQRDMLRQQREGQQNRWSDHGRELTEQHTQLRNRLKQTQEDDRMQRTSDASDLKASLKKLNEMTDDTILLVNTERRNRVRAETGEKIIRHAKMTFLNERWNSADELRDQLEQLRRRQRSNEQQYLDHAHMVRASAKAASDSAHRAQKEEQMREALELRAWEKRMAEEMKAAKDREINRKRALHEQMEADKLVPDEELMRAVATTEGPVGMEDSTTGEGPAAMFSRFFGFRKRGSGHQLTSVAL